MNIHIEVLVASIVILTMAAMTSSKGAVQHKKVFCYYEADSQYRKYPGKFLPHNLDPDLCTHIIFAFVGVKNNTFRSVHWNDLGPWGLYKRTVSLKTRNPDIKVLLAVGGWVADYGPFEEAVSTENKMVEFASNAIGYLREHSMDGLDMDWEFPGIRDSPPEDKWKFTRFMQIIQDSFKAESIKSGKPKLLLTLASAVGIDFINAAYEPTIIHRHVDYMLLMTYNFHGGWGNFTGHHSPILSHPSDVGEDRNLCQAWAVNYWLYQGVPKDKVILGLSTYGMSFTLENSTDNGVNAPVLGNGKPGRYSRQSGVLAYYEICDLLRDPESKRVYVPKQEVPYVTKGDQWVGYDDASSLKNKVKTLIHELDLAGAFIWSVDLDDFNGYCGYGKYPLLKSVNEAIRNPPNTVYTDTVFPSSACDKVGSGVHADVTSCHRYIFCSQGKDGRYSQYTYWCSPGLSFVSLSNAYYCVAKFDCI